MLEQALRDCDFDPNDLERTEERLFALRAAARKYAVPADGLAGLAARFADDLDALDAGEANIGALEKTACGSEQRSGSRAEALSQARRRLPRNSTSGAKGIAAAQASKTPLHDVNRKRSEECGPEGWDRSNSGCRQIRDAAGPLMKVASGGELARFMLALKVSLADRGSAPTLVFDEIDTGVGGAVADALVKDSPVSPTRSRCSP